jgi:hypothetical protein
MTKIFKMLDLKMRRTMLFAMHTRAAIGLPSISVLIGGHSVYSACAYYFTDH